MQKKYIQELDDKYPTGSTRQRQTRRGKRLAKWKEQQMLGSQGPASGIRWIDPATVDLSKYGISKAVEDSMIPWSE